jgi:hypothetical protein
MPFSPRPVMVSSGKTDLEIPVDGHAQASIHTWLGINYE